MQSIGSDSIHLAIYICIPSEALSCLHLKQNWRLRRLYMTLMNFSSGEANRSQWIFRCPIREPVGTIQATRFFQKSRWSCSEQNHVISMTGVREIQLPFISDVRERTWRRYVIRRH